MWEKLCPDLYIKNIYELNLDYLKKKGILGILVDLDNTLLPWNKDSIDEKLKNWINECSSSGIKLCIVSNNKPRRIKDCAKKLNIPAVSGVIKPRKKAFLKALKILNMNPEQVAVVGDQIFTDILGAKRLGLFAILVEPLNENEFFGTKLIRIIEKIVIKKLKDPI